MKKILSLLTFLMISSSLAYAQTGSALNEKEIIQVEWKGKTYKKGDRVRIISRSGTMKPDETGYPKEIEGDKGRTGTIIRGMKREATSYFKPAPDEPIQIVMVKWDAQKWKIAHENITVDLKPFQSTIHVEYLEVVR